MRNRCYSRRTKKSSYELLNGRVPNVSKLQKFGSVCFAYKQEEGKPDSRYEQGVFVGYDKNSPAYLVYYPDTGSETQVGKIPNQGSHRERNTNA